MMSDFDNPLAGGQQHSPGVSMPGAGAPSALEGELAQLNRRLHELTEDLTSFGLDAQTTGQPQPAQPPFAMPGPGPAAQAPAESDAQRRAREIIEAAQRTADQLIGDAQRQAALANRQIDTVRGELDRARAQAQGARRQALEQLLLVGEQLLSSARRVIGIFEQEPPHVPPMPTAPPPAAPSMPPTPPAHAQPAPVPAVVIDEYPAQAPAMAPAAALLADGYEQAGRRAGVYAPPSVAPPAAEPQTVAPQRPQVHLGTVTLTVGPLADVASAAVLERAVERIPAVLHSRVKRFVDARVSIELNLVEAVVLADELRRVLPYPFEVQAVAPSELDIVIVSVPERPGGMQVHAEGQPR